ncbi:hypothetical protein ACOME3_003739 [Neoechinorhynchus agilis]
MNSEQDSDTSSTLIDVALKKCFEKVSDTLKDSLIEAMITVKDVLTEAIQREKEALKSEKLVETKKRKENKSDGSKRQTTLSKGESKKLRKILQKSGSETATKENAVLVEANKMSNSNEHLLETSVVQKTSNSSTIIRDLVPPSEDIESGVLNDFKIIVEEYDIKTLIKGSDRKSESDAPPEATTKTKVKQMVSETSERAGRRAKGGAKNYKEMSISKKMRRQ